MNSKEEFYCFKSFVIKGSPIVNPTPWPYDLNWSLETNMAGAAEAGVSSKSKEPIRELPEADIFEREDFGDDTVTEELSQLQKDLKAKLKNRKDVAGQCLAYNKLGTAYHRLFKFDKAELCHHYHQHLSKPVLIAIPFQDKRTGNRHEEKCALVNLGCVYHAKREYELALLTFKEASDIADEVS